MQRILYVISEIDKALEFEWVAEYLDRERFELHFALLNPGDSQLSKFVKAQGHACHTFSFHGKKDLLNCTWKVFNLIRKIKPAIVHTHLFEGSLAGIIAARLAGVKHRIYTRHHSNWHHKYHPHAVKYDRIINAWATDIVSISPTVSEILCNLEGVSSDKITLIPHGIEYKNFEKVTTAEIAELKLKYNPEKKGPVVGVISRYTEWKGVHFILPAFKKLLKKYPTAFLILANAKGDYEDEIKTQLQELPTTSYVEIVFEQNLYALYQLFDVFVHAPIDTQSEAFGQIYIESLAAGIPSIFTVSGIAPELVKHEGIAQVVPHQDSEAIYSALLTVLEKGDAFNLDTEAGKALVNEKFNLSTKIDKLEKLYLSKNA